MTVNSKEERHEQHVDLNQSPPIVNQTKSSDTIDTAQSVDEPHLNFFSKWIPSNQAKIGLGAAAGSTLGAGLGAAIFALQSYLSISIASLASPMLISGVVTALIGAGMTRYVLNKKNTEASGSIEALHLGDSPTSTKALDSEDLDSEDELPLPIHHRYLEYIEDEERHSRSDADQAHPSQIEDASPVDEPKLNCLSRLMQSNNVKSGLDVGLFGASFALQSCLALGVASIVLPMHISRGLKILMGCVMTHYALNQKNAENSRTREINLIKNDASEDDIAGPNSRSLTLIEDEAHPSHHQDLNAAQHFDKPHSNFLSQLVQSNYAKIGLGAGLCAASFAFQSIAQIYLGAGIGSLALPLLTSAISTYALSARQDVLTLTAHNETLTTQNEVLTGDNIALTADNVALTASNKALTSQNDALTAHNETLIAQNEALTASYRALIAKTSPNHRGFFRTYATPVAVAIGFGLSCLAYSNI